MINTVFLFIFIFLQIADIWTTKKALDMGKREVNPFLNKLFEKYDPVASMIAVKLPAVWLLWYIDAYFLTIASCAVYVWVVLNNWKVIEGKK